MTRLRGADAKIWTVALEIEETDDETRVHARLDIGDRPFAGFGRARRNPIDPAVPRIGEELATARALSSLSHNLMDEAGRLIEALGPVRSN